MSDPPPPTDPAPAPSRASQEVRRKSQRFFARVLESAQTISTLGLGDGPDMVQAAAGDIVISNDRGIALEVLTPALYLHRYEPITPSGGLHLSDDDISRLAKCLRFGATSSAREFVSAVEGLALVEIGEIRVPFTPGQIGDLKRRADKRGMPPEKYIAMVVEHIGQQFFISKSE